MTNSTNTEQSKKQQASESNQIRVLGWTQGSIFVPGASIVLPYKFDPENQVLVITTQSCSVVSPNFDRDPLVEAIMAVKLSKFNERAPEATGKNQRKLHIQTENRFQGCVGLECNIHKRFFFDRKKLLDFSPTSDLVIGDHEIKKLARWLGRSYTRIALPDELVENMQQNLLPTIDKILSQNHKDQTLHSEIDSIYISWSSIEGKATAKSFILSLIFVCKSQMTADFLDEALDRNLNEFRSPSGQDHLHIRFIRCGTKNDTFLSDLDDHDRLSEWDYLTSFGGTNWFIGES